jgi:hypothetical protein
MPRAPKEYHDFTSLMDSAADGSETRRDVEKPTTRTEPVATLSGYAGIVLRSLSRWRIASISGLRRSACGEASPYISELYNNPLPPSYFLLLTSPF